MILPLHTRVRSLRDPEIVGEVQGFGTLFVPETPSTIQDHDFDSCNPVVVYLVWPESMIGSSSLPGQYVHVLDVDQVVQA